jgi:phenylpropionate dioxygenase-like ring-hydroxylating dioxygenase large terminal subunit
MNDDAGPDPLARCALLHRPAGVRGREGRGSWPAPGSSPAMPASWRNPGDYVAFEMAGESLFCIRGRDGVIRTFYNVCQHRAHQLVRAKAMPAWCLPLPRLDLRADRRLARRAQHKSVPGFDKSKICLTEVRTEVFLGFVFVNLDPDAAPMDDWFPGAAELEASCPTGPS